MIPPTETEVTATPSSNNNNNIVIEETIQLHRDIKGHFETDILYTNSNNTNNDVKIVVVSGNPGIVGFYVEFIKQLYFKLDQKYDIVGVSHIGHCGKLNEQFTCEDQIEHKRIVLEYLVNTKYASQKNTVKFILIGHSVGSYISLKVLNRFKDQFTIIKQINLFPTFRNLYDGLSPFIKLAVQNWMRAPVASFLHYVPNFVKDTILGQVLPTDDMRVAVQHKINYWSALNILYMAYHETLDITKVDDECKQVFDNRMDDLLFIYGRTDPYTPLNFFQELKASYPNGSIELAAEGVPHAFVLSHSTTVAERVSNWIIDQLSSSS
ncbi:hypothetical protein DFA_02573 [Cavenderia fasciculata]|uniref:Lipid droplet-associated serine hydrolase n=1 Tax=Cavenderia fasciculata TaxID=261658 RepID=F4PZS0_CACFS|nr:uncharacterized protein DFA_02573 [Cavenderia fasciculata]EGG18834.1 hypothetical protein DFA_02573 [Cavenderia fasciculata]|eukprot:XP_004357296.1 hypothetical protein DFA_02573 [Cavenderia fasciculata]